MLSITLEDFNTCALGHYWCVGCGEQLPIASFGINNRRPRGLQDRCKNCTNLSKQQWRITGVGMTNALIVERRKKTRQDYKRTAQAKRYNTTVEYIEELFQEQNGQCAICTKRMSWESTGINTETYSVDHCHSTGKIRGLLCHSCNVGIGYFKDSPELLKSAMDYLEASASLHSTIRYLTGPTTC